MSWWIFGKKEETKLPEIREAPVENIDNNFENIGVTRELQASSPNFAVAKKSEPFFVRIDKFQDAKKNLGEIGKRLKEMETVLGKINETKIKEDEEIASWKEEMKNIRSFLSTIDQNLFNRVQF
jgi:hypothetical protein